MSTANELVSVNLKMLINLAKPAATLNLFRSRIRAQQSGGHLSRTKGRGMEFDEVRPYQPGEKLPDHPYQSINFLPDRCRNS